MRKNFLLDTDSYKYSHYLQYKPGVTNISSYISARACDFTDEIVFAGLQPWIIENLENYVVTLDDVLEVEDYCRRHGVPFNVEGFRDLVGKPIPIRIQALSEGTIVKPGVVMVQVMNTDATKPWITSFMETSMLRAIWYMTTVATISRECKKTIKKWLDKTGTPDLLPFKLHDFGFRGVTSWESGVLGGMGHLINFMGTDTMGAIRGAKKYYGEPMAGFSIPAAEHSTITSWGRDGEAEAYANMVRQFGGPGKIYAVVSDSYDIYNACDVIWGQELKQLVIDTGGTLVIRPDSGDPMIVVPKVLEILGSRFGYTVNSKGYKVLSDCVRVIQGDGVNRRMIDALLGKLAMLGWSADNVAFGMGGALLQGVTRDDLNFAMKGSAQSMDGGLTWTGFAKDPVTQSMKKSLSGRQAVVSNNVDLINIPESELDDPLDNHLEERWDTGKFLEYDTFTQVRENAEV